LGFDRRSSVPPLFRGSPEATRSAGGDSRLGRPSPWNSKREQLDLKPGDTIDFIIAIGLIEAERFSELLDKRDGFASVNA
jgi:hypothetical protein